jgi:O-antigen/teichoic acid export membrane protein
VKVKAFRQDALIRSSALLLLSTVEVAAGGFLFWQISARLFTPDQVGRTSALITASALIANLALLGMQNSVIRYLHEWDDPAGTVNSAVTVVTAAAAAGAGLFVAAAGVLAPELTMLREPGNAALFMVFTVALAVTLINDNVFIGLQRSGHVAGRNTLTVVLRLALPFAVTGLGAFGLFTAYQGAATVALIAYLFVLRHKLAMPTRLRVDRARFAAMWRYSAGNYLATILLLFPALVMPMVVAHRLDPAHAAYYYIASLVAGVLTFVPQATSRSLFAQASADPSGLRPLLRRVVLLTAAVQVPALAVLIAAGPLVLRLFGPAYATAYPLLVVLLIGAALAGVGFVGNALMLVVGRLTVMCVVTAVAAVVAVGGAYLFAGRGLLWIGGSLLAGELVLCLTYLPLIASISRPVDEEAR